LSIHEFLSIVVGDETTTRRTHMDTEIAAVFAICEDIL
jgi:hypothetical protein